MPIPSPADFRDRTKKHSQVREMMAQMAESAAEINFVNENAIFNPSLVNSDGVDFNTLVEFGYHKIATGPAWDASLNKPTGLTGQWAFVLVLPLSATVVCQLVYCFNAKKIAFRFSTTATSWSEWVMHSGDAFNQTAINTAIAAVTSTLNTTLSNNASFTPKRVADNLDFNSLVEFGFHKIASSTTWDSCTNKPTDVTGQWAYVLVLPLSATVVLQFIFGFNSKKLHFRFSTTATSWSSWSAISGDAYVDSSVSKAVSDYSLKVNPIFSAKSKNLFDAVTMITGKVISSTGVLNDNVNGVVTSLIDVSGGSNLSISGLQASAAYRAIRFLDANKNHIQTLSIGPSLTNKTYAIPGGAKWAQQCLKEATDAFILDTSTIQIELSGSPTAYTPYVRGDLIEIFGSSLNTTQAGQVSKAIGASYLLFGDSITQSSPVDSGIFDQTTSPFPNWPTYAKDQLKMGKFRNYAKSGASFRNKNLEPLQFLRNQVELAITNGETADVIVVACGTNDGISSLGTYEAAMAKTTLESLDQTICMEAARWIFWKLRLQYPDAVCFFCNPLQRASNTVEELAPMVDGLSKMAQRHGFILIDQNKESGIIRELEVLNGAGKYLADGLHPNTAGRMRQANLIVSKIISYMSY